MAEEANPFLLQLYRRAFGAQDPTLVQVSFHLAVLDRYCGTAGISPQMRLVAGACIDDGEVRPLGVRRC